ncbi:MAG: DNA polymerase-4 [Marinoscillum sp.]|jgi:DNA polymerase-4
MDAFYASVEQRDDPSLRGKPVAVGGSKERGVVAAASYEARKFGVKSAMASSIAARRCPDLIFVPPHFEKYRDVSLQINEVFKEYTDLIEPLSLDEAYLDVTENKIGLYSATLIAKEIKHKIKERTSLTASAGISYCKFLAKTASDVKKPDGLFVILPSEAQEYLHKMSISKFHGIGKSTAEKMKQVGIFTGKDLAKKSLEDLTLRFGKMGLYYYQISRGIDERPVVPDRARKSISAETTLETNLMNREAILKVALKIAEETYLRYSKKDVKGKTITLKIKFGDFTQITKSNTLSSPVSELAQLIKEVVSLCDHSVIHEAGVRLVGVGISNFQENKITTPPTQLTLNF